MRAVQPDLVVNAAAYTAVDLAERERDAAFAVNAKAPEVLASEAKRAGAVLIHYSTDFVFDGTATVPYAEDAPVAPLNVYGASKLAGEQAIAASGAHALTLRTSWVYGRRGRNFLLTIRRLAAERDELTIVADQTGTPNWAVTLAEATATLVGRGTGLPRGARGPVSPERRRRDHLVWFRQGHRRRRRASPRRADSHRGLSHARPPSVLQRVRHAPPARRVRPRTAAMGRSASRTA